MKCVSRVILFSFFLANFTVFGQIPDNLQGNDPNVKADFLLSQGKLAEERGDLQAAEEYFQKSLQISENLHPGSLTVARSLNGLGDVAQARGLPSSAKSYYQRALVIIQAVDPASADAADSLQGLALAAGDCREFSKLEEYGSQAMAIRGSLNRDSLEVAASLNVIGRIQLHHGDQAKAINSYQQALTIQEKLAPESLAVAETLRNLGTLYFSSRQYERAETYYRRALEIRQKVAPESLAVANSLWWMGVSTRANPSEQEKYYRQALAIQQKMAPDSLHVAWTVSQLADAAHARDDLITAEDYYRQALAIWEKQAPASVEVTTLKRKLGNILVWLGDLEGAEAFTREALDVNQKVNPGSYDVIIGIFSLGNIAIEKGDLLAADGYYHQALELSEKLPYGDSLVARMLRGLGVIAADRGDLRTAEEYYHRALTIWEKTEPGSGHVAEGLFSIGLAAYQRGDLAQAEQCYLRALAIWEKVLPESSFFAQGLETLGRVAHDRGDLNKAEAYYRQALAIEEKRYPGSADLAEVLNDLGSILEHRGDLTQAEECYRRALAIREKVFPGTTRHAASLVALAGIMRRKQQLDAAARFYEQALDAVENRTAHLGGGDELRADFRAQRAGYYREYIDLLLEQNHPEAAFTILERFRARSLLETLAMAQADIHKSADPELLKQEGSLRETLIAKTQRRIHVLAARGHDIEIAELDKEIQDLSSQYEEVRDRIRVASPSYAALTQPRPVSVKQAQEQLLDENTLLLEYSLSKERSYLWALTRNSLTTYELPSRGAIESVARELYSQLSAPIRNGGPGSPHSNARQRKYEDLTATLSQMILAPAAAQMKKARRLLIVSDGALQYIPFATLPAPETMPDKQQQAELLLMTHEVVNLPSASALALLQRETIGRQKPRKEVVVLADPVFDKNDSRVTTAERERIGKVVSAGMNQAVTDTNASRAASDQLTRAVADVGIQTGPFLRRLPFSRREAKAILSVVPPGQGMQALDFQASRAATIGPELSHYRVIHFATHGILDSEHPEFSGLIFSLVNARGEQEDGFLGLNDIYNLNLSADLVVLSACDTGLGKEIQGEGLVGLTQGFMYAGVPQIVASLWSVDDAATAELMAHFYRHMEKDGMRPSAALRQAQMEILKQERWKKPYFWAGFVIQGDRR